MLRHRVTETAAEKELHELIDSAYSVKKSATKATDMFFQPYRGPVLVDIMFKIGTQALGINALAVHAFDLFEYLESSIDPAYCTCALALINMLTAWISGSICSRYKRKSFLAYATIATVSIQMVTGALYGIISISEKQTSWSDLNSILCLLSVLILYFVFGIGLLPMIQIYAVESLPTIIRSSGLALSTSLSFGVLSGNVYVHPILVEWIGYHYTFLITAVAGGLFYAGSIPFAYETKGKSISDIDNYYNNLLVTYKNKLSVNWQ